MNSEPIIENKIQTEICKDVADFMIETDDFYIGCVANVPEYKSMPPVLIENILHQGHTMLLYGPSKSYKSFLLLMLCIALATGGEWLGNKCSQGNVLIIEFENGEVMTHDRLKLILEENNIDKNCLSRISILTLKNHPDINTLVDGLIKNVPVGLYSAIIIDPIYKLFDGAESQAEVVDGVLSKIDALSKKLEASLILCHHTKKETQGYQSMVDKISGSSIIGRDVPSLVCISAVYENKGYNKEQIKTKLRHFPHQEPFYINIKGASYTKDSAAEANSNKDVSASKTEIKAERYVKDLIRYYKFLENKVGRVALKDLEELMQSSRNTIKKYIDETPGFSRDNKGIVVYKES